MRSDITAFLCVSGGGGDCSVNSKHALIEMSVIVMAPCLREIRHVVVFLLC